LPNYASKLTTRHHSLSSPFFEFTIFFSLHVLSSIVIADQHINLIPILHFAIHHTDCFAIFSEQAKYYSCISFNFISYWIEMNNKTRLTFTLRWCHNIEIKCDYILIVISNDNVKCNTNSLIIFCYFKLAQKESIHVFLMSLNLALSCRIKRASHYHLSLIIQ
jgi:hypothetical protein